MKVDFYESQLFDFIAVNTVKWLILLFSGYAVSIPLL